MINIIKLNYISFLTILRKEVIRILRIWPQTLLPPIVTSVLYFIIFGNIMGSKIGYVHGYSYIHYIIPGLLMMIIITSSYSNVVASFFGSKFQRNIEEILISPTFNFIIILGYLSGGIIRSFIIYLLILLLTYFFYDIQICNCFLLCLIYILTSILFSLFGLINGIFAKKFDDISIIPNFILTPLIYFGGIFYSIELLPKFFKIFVFINPIYYIVNTFRYSVLGISEINVVLSIFLMFIFIIILYLLSYYLLYIGYEIKK
jgi:ABC-2 type transport system permease protein